MLRNDKTIWQTSSRGRRKPSGRPGDGEAQPRMKRDERETSTITFSSFPPRASIYEFISTPGGRKRRAQHSCDGSHLKVDAHAHPSSRGVRARDCLLSMFYDG